MKKLFLILIVPLLFGAFFIGCEPVELEDGEFPTEEQTAP